MEGNRILNDNEMEVQMEKCKMINFLQNIFDKYKIDIGKVEVGKLYTHDRGVPRIRGGISGEDDFVRVSFLKSKTDRSIRLPILDKSYSPYNYYGKIELDSDYKVKDKNISEEELEMSILFLIKKTFDYTYRDSYVYSTDILSNNKKVGDIVIYKEDNIDFSINITNISNFKDLLLKNDFNSILLEEYNKGIEKYRENIEIQKKKKEELDKTLEHINSILMDYCNRKGIDMKGKVR